MYISRIMAKKMLLATANSTSVYFGFNHMSHKHNFTMEHIERCDEIIGCATIRKIVKKLKEKYIYHWNVEERRLAIVEFASLAI